jgi:hypothetical protein
LAQLTIESPFRDADAFSETEAYLPWLGQPFPNKVNGGGFSIHQQEAAPFEIFHYVIAPRRSKLALVLRH